MTALFRSQGIPTKLEVGYSGDIYHAWISTYVEEKGWVDHIVEFHGNEWHLLDPTLGASNDKESVSQYIGDVSEKIKLKRENDKGRYANRECIPAFVF